MRDGTIYYDTGACLNGDHIGDINQSTISPQEKLYYATGIEVSPYAQDYTEFGNWSRNQDVYKQVYNSENGQYSYVQDLTVDLSVSGINYYNEDIYKDTLQAFIDMVDDCDIDCQSKGSQMTLFATLMGTLFGLIGLNALFMFIGTWRYRWRVCSVYCTLFACLFQFAVIITSATMLFSSYTTVMCATSLNPTMGDSLPWYMADDWAVNVMLWVGQIFLMFGFLACGLCSAMKSED